jgi:hypothetical protein
MYQLSSELDVQNERLIRELAKKDQMIEKLRSRIEWLEQKLRENGVELSEQGQFFHRRNFKQIIDYYVVTVAGAFPTFLSIFFYLQSSTIISTGT